ncbi:MAG: ATP-dependent DNA ligase [Ruminiclostridium sp.]|nr:ATP-dependent DNA ligase [Ruminiclostridium sp.]
MDWIQPMEPILISDIVTGRNWIHEIKWDGIRGLSYIENGRLRVYTKRGNERTAFYPELSEITELIDTANAILDGEIVVFDDSGNPSFYSSLIRERVRDIRKVRYYSQMYPAKYILFDILHLNGRSLTRLPLFERKMLLESIVTKSDTITLTDPFDQGEDLYSLMKSKNWEGIVSKQKESRYISGKAHNLWFKTKLSRKMLTVVGGIQWKDNIPNSLLIGVYRSASLTFVGKASLGLNQEQLHILKEQASSLSQEESPFERESLSGIKGNFTWLTPLLTCWVHFMEYTGDGHLRHPKILGFGTAKPSEANGKEYVE